MYIAVDQLVCLFLFVCFVLFCFALLCFVLLCFALLVVLCCVLFCFCFLFCFLCCLFCFMCYVQPEVFGTFYFYNCLISKILCIPYMSVCVCVSGCVIKPDSQFYIPNSQIYQLYLRKPNPCFTP